MKRSQQNDAILVASEFSSREEVLRRFLALIPVVFVYATVLAEPDPGKSTQLASPVSAVDYASEVRPLLERRCYACHGRLKQKAGLRLDAGQLVLKGSQDGPVVIPGQSAASPLIHRLLSEDETERMPPEGKALPAEHIEILRRWIDAGALFPKDEVVPSDPAKHWAFLPLKRPPVPRPENASWSGNPIDNFILSKLESKGWSPSPPSPMPQWFRRLHLDVVGLPPTPAEQVMFETSLDRVPPEIWVDRLLARPEYGERWSRHWLDLVRFAESNGYERDAAKPFAWRYRDYVIDSLNGDKSWDRFLMEQIAGDEIPDASSETAIATTYYRLGPWDDEPADPATDRFDQLDDILSTTSLAFLGLNLGCARCHDHKFEPLSTRDYYSLLAVFDPLQRPRNGREELTLPAGSPHQVAAFEASQVVRKSGGKEVSSVGASLPQGYLLNEPNLNPPPTRILTRGLPSRPGEVVEPGAPKIISAEPMSASSIGIRTTGRRLALARWLTSPANPLVARVLVNRVWLHHFGEGLVRTPNNFGVSGDAPTHPELLDWLAHWFLHDARGSLKQLHRLILTSQTYRMSKSWNETQGVADPENRLLWRFPYRRLEVEAIRDSILAASGKLNQLFHGPSIFPPVPRQILEGNSDPDKIWKQSDEAQSSRRTVYAFLKRAMILPFLEVLDLCDTTQASPRRAVTTVPTQALTLFNGDFVNGQAQHFAARLSREAGPNPTSQIQLAFRLCLCRPPTAQELETLRGFLDRGGSLSQLCRAMLNLNEFVYPD